MNKSYDPNEEYLFPAEEQVQDDLALAGEYRPGGAQQAHEIPAEVEYVEEENHATPPGFLDKFPIKNKRLWIVVGVAIVVVIGAVILKHHNNTVALDPSANIAPVNQSVAEVSQLKQELNAQGSQFMQAAQAMQDQLNQSKQQVANNNAVVNQLKDQMAQMQNAMNQLANGQYQLNGQLQKIDTKLHGADKPSAAKVAVAAKPVVFKPKQYILQAIDPSGDLAWVQDQDGNNITVKMGQVIPGTQGQLVASIDSVNGQVITNNGTVIKYKV